MNIRIAANSSNRNFKSPEDPSKPTLRVCLEFEILNNLYDSEFPDDTQATLWQPIHFTVFTNKKKLSKEEAIIELKRIVAVTNTCWENRNLPGSGDTMAQMPVEVSNGEVVTFIRSVAKIPDAVLSGEVVYITRFLDKRSKLGLSEFLDLVDAYRYLIYSNYKLIRFLCEKDFNRWHGNDLPPFNSLEDLVVWAKS